MNIRDYKVDGSDEGYFIMDRDIIPCVTFVPRQ